jgi:putative ABC transport system permease protein
MILVMISNLISWPVAYYLMDKWLTGFAYRMDFGFSPFVANTLIPFVISLFITITIALITISSLSVRAAYSNPVDNITRE